MSKQERAAEMLDAYRMIVDDNMGVVIERIAVHLEDMKRTKKKIAKCGNAKDMFCLIEDFVSFASEINVDYASFARMSAQVGMIHGMDEEDEPCATK